VLNGEHLSRLPQVENPAVKGLITRLEDDVRELPCERIAWSTFWVLSWEPYPGATAYELQVLTGEGVTPTLRRQRERFLRIEVAANENERAEGLVNRDLQLALRVGQLAYRVRAVLNTGSVSAWSPPIPVGKVTNP
jgi:hypothetical protein